MIPKIKGRLQYCTNIQHRWSDMEGGEKRQEELSRKENFRETVKET